jgi:hypothetical protein
MKPKLFRKKISLEEAKRIIQEREKGENKYGISVETEWIYKKIGNENYAKNLISECELSEDGFIYIKLDDCKFLNSFSK